MSEKVDLGSGEWAVIRDPKEVTEGEREALLDVQDELLGTGAVDLFRERAQLGEQVSEKEAEKILAPALKEAASTGGFRSMRALTRHLVGVLVESWSFDFPVSAENAKKLKTGQFDKLAEKCSPHLARLLGMTTDEDVENLDSPTGTAEG